MNTLVLEGGGGGRFCFACSAGFSSFSLLFYPLEMLESEALIDLSLQLNVNHNCMCPTIRGKPSEPEYSIHYNHFDD